jgi:hypothetical protein
MRHPLRLKERTFVPIQAEPSQTLQNALHQLLTGPLGIGVFDSEDESSLVLSGKQPIEKGSPGTTYMEESGGTGCKTNSNTHKRPHNTNIPTSPLDPSLFGQIGEQQ